MKPFHLEIVTPEGAAFSGEAESLLVRTGDGDVEILAGHTDYIGRIFFDNIRNLDTGDEVIVRNYWEDITYRVIDRKIVAEDEVDDLLIQTDRQLLTLVTCIRGEDGFDRFLVICEKQ